jgi:hypothetical protein
VGLPWKQVNQEVYAGTNFIEASKKFVFIRVDVDTRREDAVFMCCAAIVNQVFEGTTYE